MLDGTRCGSQEIDPDSSLDWEKAMIGNTEHPGLWYSQGTVGRKIAIIAVPCRMREQDKDSFRLLDVQCELVVESESGRGHDEVTARGSYEEASSYSFTDGCRAARVWQQVPE